MHKEGATGGDASASRGRRASPTSAATARASARSGVRWSALARGADRRRAWAHDRAVADASNLPVESMWSSTSCGLGGRCARSGQRPVFDSLRAAHAAAMHVDAGEREEPIAPVAAFAADDVADPLRR
jgi:hypothetical protein